MSIDRGSVVGSNNTANYYHVIGSCVEESKKQRDSPVSVLCVIAKHHEFESVKEACGIMGYTPVDSLPKIWRVRKESSRQPIEISFMLLDFTGPDVVGKLTAEDVNGYDYFTTVGCCAGHPWLKLETVIPFVEASVGRHRVKCKTELKQGLDTAAKKYAELARNGTCTASMLNTAKPDTTTAFISKDKVLHPDLLREPLVLTVPKLTDAMERCLADILEAVQAIGLEMEVGYLWQKIESMSRSDGQKLAILPAFKGINDTGASTMDSKRIRVEHRRKAAKNACFAMLVYLDAHF